VDVYVLFEKYTPHDIKFYLLEIHENQ